MKEDAASVIKDEEDISLKKGDGEIALIDAALAKFVGTVDCVKEVMHNAASDSDNDISPTVKNIGIKLHYNW